MMLTLLILNTNIKILAFPTLALTNPSQTAIVHERKAPPILGSGHGRVRGQGVDQLTRFPYYDFDVWPNRPFTLSLGDITNVTSHSVAATVQP